MIHVVRVLDELLDLQEINEVASKMREQMLAKYRVQYADIVVVQGSSKETLRLFGDTYSTSRVRAAMFNAALSWHRLTT